MANKCDALEEELPQKLAELMETYQEFQQATEYCKRRMNLDNPSEEDIQQIREYLATGVANASHDIHAVSTVMTQYLSAQAREVKDLEVDVNSEAVRIRVCQELAAAHDGPDVPAADEFPETPKVEELENDSISFSASDIASVDPTLGFQYS
mmetsp:Transcript_29541/g.82559  ORF Transcript_29541/g.82559 Transcript_29541/m.82559 type:complete len:152 (+) Transcript_29541:47-502(+)